MDKIDEILTRGVENIIPGREPLEMLLRAGKKLNIYNGIDPTATRMHIGHAFPLRKLQALVDLGHNVTFLIGDFTALIGDTSDKEGERPILTSEEIEKNFQTYKKQAEKVLDFSRVKVVHNSDWLRKLTFSEIVELCQHFSLGDFISRELIRRRMDEGTKVRLDEVLYPVMQGYDSYFMNTDMQVGGTDQTFNMQAGRTLQKDLRGKESFVLATGFLEGTDGRKMSKSWGNAIWIEDSPDKMFGKVMSLKDSLIIQYFTLATDLPLSEIAEIETELAQGGNPMLAKKTLAHRIVTELHGQSAAASAQEQFENLFQKQDVASSDIPTFALSDLPKNVQDAESILFASGLTESKSEAKRLLRKNAVELNGHRVGETKIEIQANDILKVGKKRFLRFV